MEKSTLVSIILPVFNGEKHIMYSIESVLSQSYSNLELIIVNDCSNDRTPEIIEKYAVSDERVRIINNATNLRLPKTLNVGFSNASGDYLTWTSDDNIYKNNAIEIMVNTLDANPSYDMVYSNYSNIDEYGEIINNVTLQSPDNLFDSNTVGACFLYTKKIAEKIGVYDSNLFLAEDYDYWLRIYTNGNIIHINDNLYLYRRHSESLTETRKNQIQMQTYNALEKNFLPLYYKASVLNHKNQFFDHLLQRAGDERSAYTAKMLYTISPSYRFHICKKKAKCILRNILK